MEPTRLASRVKGEWEEGEFDERCKFDERLHSDKHHDDEGTDNQDENELYLGCIIYLSVASYAENPSRMLSQLASELFLRAQVKPCSKEEKKRRSKKGGRSKVASRIRGDKLLKTTCFCLALYLFISCFPFWWPTFRVYVMTHC